ncbi:phage baseplate assembly protein V [Desulfovibrio ferrophilus]|uniref:Phage baseplate assembly protein V n=1 Tax=Desulfovibrio ferrophilus TaxID=241368 RepID=A0A2Z6AYX2_9BACT|nr:phage baseplate assembly protein V [Desulfovibrio ferrophilus]BBD08452.1 phage baseplate assembly protein V [Desulfovibrio ferrophilus]
MEAFRSSDLERRVARLICFGTVEEADYPAARVRVRMGKALSAWLPWLTQRAGNDRSWWAPSIGEQVVVLSPSGECAQGVILGSIYQAKYPAPAVSPHINRRVYSDGAVIDYDTESHRLHALIPGDAFVEASGDITAQVGKSINMQAGTRVTISAPLIELDAALIHLIGAIQTGGRGGEIYPVELNGPANQTGGDFVNEGHDVKASGISLTGHVHDCPHDGETGAPK